MSRKDSPSSTAPGRRIDELESFRGLAALLVVFFHMPKWNDFLSANFFRNGYLMVPLFFVLSGFVISSAYGNRLASGIELARFQFLRFGRLYPVHILFLTIFLIIEFMKLIAQNMYGMESNLPPFTRNSIGAFIENIFLISAIIPYNPTTFNYPAWSISVEFYTYLLFGFTVLRFRRWMNYAFFALSALSMAAIVTGMTFGMGDLLSCLFGFFLGCLTELLVRRRPFAAPDWLPDGLCLILMLFLMLKTDEHWDFVIYFVSAALIYALVHARAGLAKRVLQHRLLVWLGTISYSLYMSHAAIQWFVAQIVRVVFHRPQIIDDEGRLVPHLNLFEAAVATTVVILLVIAVSALCYRYVEKPMREVSRRIAAGIGRKDAHRNTVATAPRD